ncbi:MAG: hypothetical protein BGO82_17125 [Devosia sp. 67-54]|uniref:hypothetical protein n=1 Tax=unclassified Devosia TaxID=196773 RepID=UPI000960A366|nr:MULTISPECIES: hypothetical protein [unclassified Devosia]MBN9304096.1 hypothetical protein [Devosia sp.]OJX17932.1 MAG: hypothetical protein BGO82_17125 [Devosia sp. 67-54]
MTGEVLQFHADRLRRMLRDLQLDPASLLPAPDGALVDDISRRRLTPALDNQTLAEGLVSAVKIAASYLGEAG